MASRRRYWISCKLFTVGVLVEGGNVIEGPPITRRFLNQPIQNLIRFARQQGGLEFKVFTEKEYIHAKLREQQKATGV